MQCISWGSSQETSSSWPVQGLWWKAVKWYGLEVLSSDQINTLDLNLHFQDLFHMHWSLRHLECNRFHSDSNGTVKLYPTEPKVADEQWPQHTHQGNQAFGFHYLWEVLSHVTSWSRACTASAVSQPHFYCKDWLYSPPSTPWQTGKIPKKIPVHVTTTATVCSGFQKITFISTFLRILENSRVKLCSSSSSCPLYD